MTESQTHDQREALLESAARELGKLRAEVSALRMALIVVDSRSEAPCPICGARRPQAEHGASCAIGRALEGG